MNYPAASYGVSTGKRRLMGEASFGELNPKELKLYELTRRWNDLRRLLIRIETNNYAFYADTSNYFY